MRYLPTKFLFISILTCLILLGINPKAQLMPNSNINFDKVISEMPNIIFLIGDGMGIEQIKAASLVEYGITNGTIMDTDFPVQQLYTTNDINNEVTESTASGTALATGIRTINGIISMDSYGKYYIKTILEYLQYDFGYATGIITTTDITDATPAAFSAHVNNRYDDNNIRDQMLGKNIDVILGGGLSAPYIGGASQALKIGSSYGYDVVTDINGLKSKASTANKLLGIFPKSQLPYELERDPELVPGILDMADAAFNVLTRKEKPYFLMIEGGRIDHGGHAMNTPNTIMETIMFEKTVRYALDIAKKDGNAIVIVAGDHETGGLNIVDYSKLNNILPSNNNNRTQNNEIRVNRINQLVVTWISGEHTDTLVKFFGYGSDFRNYNISRNDEVYWAINRALGSFPTIMNHTYTQVGNTLEIRSEIKDLDSSATSVTVFVTYSNATTLNYDFALDTSKEHESYLFETPIDNAQSYNSYFVVNDQGYNDVISFDMQNKLVQQSITKSSSVSSTSSSTSSTPSSAKDSNFPFSFSLITITVLFIVKFKRKN